MHKKYHEKFKILDILAVTTQAREGIETELLSQAISTLTVTTQAREGIETKDQLIEHFLLSVTTQAREGIETCQCVCWNPFDS